MKIKKQKDGSTKVEFENENTFYVRKGIDLIDGLIDIGLIQRKTASFIKMPESSDDFLLPETFFYALSRKCFKEVCKNPQNKDWHITVATEFNLEISKQQRLRVGKEKVIEQLSKTKIGSPNQAIIGKYKVCHLDVLPELLSKSMKTTEVESADDCESDMTSSSEKNVYMLALSLLRMIHSKLDIRKIETRLSELKGLCQYLKNIAPDEYMAYCVVADRIGLNAVLDIDGYYKILEQIVERE